MRLGVNGDGVCPLCGVGGKTAVRRAFEEGYYSTVRLLESREATFVDMHVR